MNPKSTARSMRSSIHSNTSLHELKLMLVLLPVAALLFGFGVGLITGYQILSSPFYMIGVIAIAVVPAIITALIAVRYYAHKISAERLRAHSR
ncbi:hypothetical protein [Salinimonas sediminis]|uniref:Uncharacterized protein n=1 Tax=Salinimonas sediminis TaxID=2303538 RepID=A0A346NL77_9ALTE|nr:hypothetical protein [Salinimonas sediminis]AXR06284.1 hypothetical protein D0Y50_07860 [Salinimonas sediminis]